VSPTATLAGVVPVKVAVVVVEKVPLGVTAVQVYELAADPLVSGEEAEADVPAKANIAKPARAAVRVIRDGMFIMRTSAGRRWSELYPVPSNSD
jgi:hypothetical protein